MRTEELRPKTSYSDPFIRVEGEFAYIPLGKGKHKHHRYAKIDLDEIDRVCARTWYAYRGGSTWYCRATNGKTLPSHHMMLHMFIMRANKGDIVDHINGDGLDCTKGNLRLATSQQNSYNSYKTTANWVSSRFKGVRLTSSGKWFSQISKGGVPEYLGTFDTEELAAEAYDAAAVRLFGEFAKTNRTMGLFESQTINKNADNSGHLLPVMADKIDDKPNWQAHIEDGYRGYLYAVPENIEEIEREIGVRNAVKHIACPRKRRKEAKRLREEFGMVKVNGETR